MPRTNSVTRCLRLIIDGLELKMIAMHFHLEMHILAVVAAVAASGIAAVPAVDVEAWQAPRSHDQQLPLDDSTTRYSTLDVRRYPLVNERDALGVIDSARANNLDIWSLNKDYVDIYFPSESGVPAYFTSLNHTALSPALPNRETSLRPSPIGPWNVSTLANCTFHNGFHTLEEIDSFVQQLANEYPNLVELVRLGKTSENRDILALNISMRRADRPKKRRKRIVIQGAQHAREVGASLALSLASGDQGVWLMQWIASSTALYIAHSLLVHNSDPYSNHKLLKWEDFTIIPLPNPDGYVYTWNHDRLWYKNRADVHGGKCHGIDLNRNWDYAWEPAVDPDPCSHWYPGNQPFQAVEAKAISAYISRTPNIHAFLDLRNYGQLVMYPFSHTCAVHPKDEENLEEGALGAAKALTKTHGTHMGTGSLCHELYRYERIHPRLCVGSTPSENKTHLGLG
ncbi:putative metallocarboxypeptidase ecm14 [Tulasnella sp. 403]|nr:putative metallocarboxypeptidase ecm14 [Tulasnella sp. 403]